MTETIVSYTRRKTLEEAAKEVARLRKALKIALEVMENVDGENDCSRGIQAAENALKQDQR